MHISVDCFRRPSLELLWATVRTRGLTMPYNLPSISYVGLSIRGVFLCFVRCYGYAVFHQTFTYHITYRTCRRTGHVAQYCHRTNPYGLLIVWLDGTPAVLYTVLPVRILTKHVEDR
jgi:hypothetical protein